MNIAQNLFDRLIVPIILIVSYFLGSLIVDNGEYLIGLVHNIPITKVIDVLEWTLETMIKILVGMFIMMIGLLIYSMLLHTRKLKKKN